MHIFIYLDDISIENTMIIKLPPRSKLFFFNLSFNSTFSEKNNEVKNVHIMETYLAPFSAYPTIMSMIQDIHIIDK